LVVNIFKDFGIQIKGVPFAIILPFLDFRFLLFKICFGTPLIQMFLFKFLSKTFSNKFSTLYLDIIQQQQLPQFTPEGPSPNISSPYFNNISQQQLKQFQDSQRKSVGGGTNIYQQQQQQEFQRPTSNFSSSGQPQFVDQQKIQQQISSPSVTSTADLLVPNGVGGSGGQQGNIQVFIFIGFLINEDFRE